MLVHLADKYQYAVSLAPNPASKQDTATKIFHMEPNQGPTEITVYSSIYI
jgi:hypothetical protein